MAWPDIFFKSRKSAETQPPPLPVASENPESNAPQAEAAPEAEVKTQPLPPVLPQRPTAPPPLPGVKPPTQPERSTRTIPVVHGVLLRPPTRPVTGRLAFPTAAPEPIKNIEQLMAEADPVRTLSQTGSVRLLKRLSPEGPTPKPAGTIPAIRFEPVTPAPASIPTPAANTPVIAPPQAKEIASPWPSFQAKGSAPIEVKKPETIPPIQIKKAEPIPPVEAKKVEPPSSLVTARPIDPVMPQVTPLQQPRPIPKDSTFMSRPAASAPPAASTTVSIRVPPSLPPMIPIGPVTRRKAKMADVARIVLPPKREETGPLPTASGSTPAIMPPSFSVPSTSARILPRALPKLVLPQLQSSNQQLPESPFLERRPVKPVDTSTPEPAPPAPEAKVPAATVPAEITPPAEPTSPPPEPVEAKAPEEASVQPQLPLDAPEKPTEAKTVEAPTLDLPTRKPEVEPTPVEAPKTEAAAAPILETKTEIKPETILESPQPEPESPPKSEPVAAPMEPVFESVPKVDPEAHKPEPTTEVLPKLDPEAHKIPLPATEPASAPAPAPAPIASPIAPREFHLTNGERVAGVVLSETPDTVYVEHATLGVLTIPRAEIATRLVEVILINGDRIVGNVMAETPEMLYVRHASLGMLSVPRAQRSTRVVEAILKGGDRILGELLTETETFTVIKSATLGTVTVPHNQVTMLNRKAEQIEMKTLPRSSPQLSDKAG
jgi:RNase P/RNase MRP subunit p29